MDLSFKRKLGVFLVVLFSVSALAIAASSAPPLVNWTPQGSPRIGSLAKEADVGGPGVFVAIAPCRQYNSLNSTPLLQGVNRTVPISGAPCNIPAAARAASVNITIFNITGATGNGVFKVDTVTPPAVAWINYPPTETQRANAGNVALASGNIIVQVAQGAGQVDFVVDANGYFLDGSSGGVLNTGEFFGIYGNYGNGLLFAQNNSAASGASAIRGFMTSTTANAAGVLGDQTAASGANFAVWGRNNSVTSAASAVFGKAGTAGWVQQTAGMGAVRGIADGNGIFNQGVIGEGTHVGVAGFRVNSAGALQTYGYIGYAGTIGLYTPNDLSVLGTKSFVEPHPLDATKVINYVSLEGPEAGTYFRGRGRFLKGSAVIEVPEDFRMVTDDAGLTVQITPIGRMAQVGVVSMDLNQIAVESSRDVEFSYLVQGVRRAFKDHQVIAPDVEGYFRPMTADSRLPDFLSPEAKRRLISNGTYNEDGTVNMGTAERLGWAKNWRDQEARARATQSAASQASSAPNR